MLDHGEVLIDGELFRRSRTDLRKRLHFLSDFPFFYPRMSVLQHIGLVANAYDKTEPGTEHRVDRRRPGTVAVREADVVAAVPNAGSAGLRSDGRKHGSAEPQLLTAIGDTAVVMLGEPDRDHGLSFTGCSDFTTMYSDFRSLRK